MDIIQEIFEQPNDTFDSLIRNEHVTNILVSGEFGSGKTTFLTHFFRKESVLVDYHSIHLYPVNYSVLSNQDIFRYIKYDILFELLKIKGTSDLKNFQVALSVIRTLPDYIKINIIGLLSTIALAIPREGKRISQLIDKIGEHITDLKAIQKAAQLSLDVEVHNWLEEFHKEEGGLYEDNHITQFIIELIKKVKKEIKKDVVLVIDDLDRVDPEHVFRILNVISAHRDFQIDNKGSNKFGFDKIILCCDIRNIRSIYSARFGNSSDFSGYMDKFYDHSIFQFDIATGVKEYLLSKDRYIPKFKFTDEAIRKYVEGYAFWRFYPRILLDLQLIKKLTLRRFLHGDANITTIHRLKQTGIKYSQFDNFRNNAYFGLYILKSLVAFAGSKQNLLVAFTELSESDIKKNAEYGVAVAMEMLPILYLSNTGMSVGNDQYLSYKSRDSTREFRFQLEDRMMRRSPFISINVHPDDRLNRDLQVSEIYKLLRDALSKAIKFNLI